MLPKMIQDPDIWKAVDTFAKKVLTEKEVAERERDKRNREE